MGLAAQTAQPGRRRRRRIGLLGGSFNPPHEGHRHISLEALKALDIDEVWWLVSPQNPLKPAADMAPLESRLAWARAMARHPRIRVLDIERTLGTNRTAETLARLRRLFPRLRFVWLIGADNLAEMPRWYRWPAVWRAVPVAVFARPSYSQRALAGKAARRFARWRVAPRRARRLAERRPPAWTFVPCRLDPTSATAIRAAWRQGETKRSTAR